MNTKSINLHINKIVLEGVGHVNPVQLSHSVEKELQRLISTQGIHHSISQSMSIDSISARPISIGASVKEKQLGHKIAQSTYRGLKG